jgi:hypothetical protein
MTCHQVRIPRQAGNPACFFFRAPVSPSLSEFRLDSALTLRDNHAISTAAVPHLIIELEPVP